MYEDCTTCDYQIFIEVYSYFNYYQGVSRGVCINWSKYYENLIPTTGKNLNEFQPNLNERQKTLKTKDILHLCLVVLSM